MDDKLSQDRKLPQRSRSQSESIARRVSALRLSDSERCFLPNFQRNSPGVSIKPPFFPEVLNESIEKKYYPDSEQRSQYRVKVKDGIFCNHLKQRLHGAYLYTLLPNNKLYAIHEDKKCEIQDAQQGEYADVTIKTHPFHHSYLSSGLNVKGSGYLYMYNGILMCFSNESGHYKLTFAEMAGAIEWFASQAHNPFLLFEDHSQQNYSLPFRGIRFNLVKKIKASNETEISLLKSAEDLKQKLILSWNAIADRGKQKSDDTLFSLELDEDSATDSTSTPAIEIPRAIASNHNFNYSYTTEFPELNKYDPDTTDSLDQIPFLTQFTCLSRLFNPFRPTPSHFNCIPTTLFKIRQMQNTLAMSDSGSHDSPHVEPNNDLLSKSLPSRLR